MTSKVENSKFYSTYQSFINKKTITAEKTINGKKYGEKKLPENIYKNFINAISVGGLLLIPITFACTSKSYMLSKLHKIEKNIFKLSNCADGNWGQSLALKYNKCKYNILNKINDIFTPVISKKEDFYFNLNNSNNQNFLAKTYRKINGFFIGIKKTIVVKKENKIKKDFSHLKKILDKQINVLNDSANSKIKILLPEEIQINPSSMPQTIDLSKTINGESRPEKLKQLMNELENILNKEKLSLADIRKMSYSCEDIFNDAENILFYLQKKAKDFKYVTDINNSIKSIYNYLEKYKFAEITQDSIFENNVMIRQKHIEAIKKEIEKIKACKIKDKLFEHQVLNLENLLTKNADAVNMGIIENIRMLLKCNDIKVENLKDGVQPALLKHYQTDKYLELKKHLNNLSNDIKECYKVKNKIVPKQINDIEKGGMSVNVLSTAIPASFLLYKCHNAKDNNTNNKRNFLSFLVGSLTILGLNYGTIKPKSIIALYGLATTYLTAKFYDRFLKK